MRYVAFIHEQDGVFGISFPDCPGCMSVGDTQDEAIENGSEALTLYCEFMLERGRRLPSPRKLEDILNDEDLADWREGSSQVFVPLLLAQDEPQRAEA